MPRISLSGVNSRPVNRHRSAVHRFLSARVAGYYPAAECHRHADPVLANRSADWSWSRPAVLVRSATASGVKPLVLSLLLFIFSSAMCAATDDIHLLIGWRFLQGFAGAGSVLSRSIARDKYQGARLTQFSPC